MTTTRFRRLPWKAVTDAGVVDAFIEETYLGLSSILLALRGIRVPRLMRGRR